MEKYPKKLDDKKPDKADRGDKTNLLIKVLEDLEISDILPNRDRGDSRVDKSSRNFTPEKQTTKRHPNIKKKTLDISASEVKSKKLDYVLDSDDSSKKEHRIKVRKEERQKLEEAKGKTAQLNINDIHKIRTENKGRAYSEQQLKFKLETERIDETKRIEEHSKRIEEKIKRINENAKLNEETKRTDKIKNLRLPPGKDLKFIDNALERRKLLRQKYTVKLKSPNKIDESKDIFKTDDYELKNEPSERFDREIANESPKEIRQVETSKLTKKSKEATQIQRKPIIKTIKNNDHRVFKAVSFIDQKETTPLQIKIPISKKTAETNTIMRSKLKPIASKKSIQNITKEKPLPKKNTKEKKSTKRIRKRPSSPTLTTHQACPQTEVAKWAPSSINQHTKPYYEAWVDTTLAAITKCSEKDKLQLNRQQIIRTFKRAFELDSRPTSPNLIYEKVNDEKYMGRITVNKSK